MGGRGDPRIISLVLTEWGSDGNKRNKIFWAAKTDERDQRSAMAPPPLAPYFLSLFITNKTFRNQKPGIPYEHWAQATFEYLLLSRLTHQ